MTRSQPTYQPDDRTGDRHQIHQALMGKVYLCLDLEEMMPHRLIEGHAQKDMTPLPESETGLNNFNHQLVQGVIQI